MPLNESIIPRRSNLTNKQRREAELAIYGIPPSQEIILNSQQKQFTFEELEQMRMILAREEGKHVPMKEFDLNKPPIEPYRFQEFPKAMHHETLKTKIAASASHQAALEDQGYQVAPFAPEDPAEVQLTAADREEIAAIDAKLIKKKTRAA